jgi:hypothetical protein
MVHQLSLDRVAAFVSRLMYDRQLIEGRPVSHLKNQCMVMNVINVWLPRAVRILRAICLLAAMTAVVSAQNDAHIGTWELNVAKSTFNPGPPPTRQTLRYTADGRGLTAMFQGVDAAGMPMNPDPSNLLISFDGKDHPTPRPQYDSSAWTRINAHSYVVYRKKRGKVVLTSTNVVSNDGTTLTITTKGVDEDGQAINNIAIYDKQ